ncbi:hypothetical protein K8Q94_00990 [Candidatus Nomurabacteria bacterium]|nr:hypothetical protein [Candidatus Nomurabacteria bacterium]
MEKIKYFIESDNGKDILTVIIVILVGLASFGLGRLSKNTPNGGLKVEYTDQQVNDLDTLENGLESQNRAYIAPKTTSNTSQNSGNYFASKKGHKYYSAGCSAGKSLKEENKIYFETSLQAESAGYTLSSSC